MSADLWSTCALCTGDAAMATLAAAATLLRWGTVALSCCGQHLVQWQCPLTHGTSLVKGALWSVALCAPVALQGRRRSGDAAAVLRLHSTFVHSGNTPGT